MAENSGGPKEMKPQVGMTPAARREELGPAPSRAFTEALPRGDLEGAGIDQKGAAALATVLPGASLHVERPPCPDDLQGGNATFAGPQGDGLIVLPVEQETPGGGDSPGTRRERQTPSAASAGDSRRQGIPVVGQGDREGQATEGSPRQEIDFAVLEDGSLVELVEDPGDPARTALAVWREGEIFYTDRLRFGRQVLGPVQREGMILKDLRLPRGAKPYESVDKLLSRVKDLISRCVVLQEPDLFLLGRFVLSTWLVDRFPVAPYVTLVGLPQSGKTTLLKALSLICRRSLLTADITSAAFYDACSSFTPTLMIDEGGTHGNSRYLRHLLRVGTTRDVVAMRKNQSFHAYGAKVICFLEPPEDPALNSRCVWIPMREANKVGLMKPSDPEIEQLASDLQQQLLQFRFEHYWSVKLPEIPGAEALRPRTRDLFNCLAAVHPEDHHKQEYLLQFFKFHEATTQEPLSPLQNAVLVELFVAAHYYAEGKPLTVGRLTEVLNQQLKRMGDRFQLQSRKVGSVLTSLGFQRRVRTNQGWMLHLDETDLRQIHQLAKTFGIDNLPSTRLRVPLEDCRLCQESGIVRQSEKKAAPDER